MSNMTNTSAQETAVLPGDLVSVPNWREEIKKVEVSSEGSVCFVEFEQQVPDSTAVQSVAYVVKASTRVVQELYASCVLLSLNIPCAAIRVVNSDDLEWGDIKAGMKTHGHTLTPGSSTQLKLLLLLTGALNRAQLMIVEFVSGASLDFYLAKRKSGFLGSEENRAQNLDTIGQLLVADILLNNSDRIPTTVWKNEGNAGNLVISDSNEVVAIDSLVTTINPENKISKRYFDSYHEKVKGFFQEVSELLAAFLAGKPYTESAIVTTCFTFLFNNTSVNLDATQVIGSFLKGIIKGVLKVAQLEQKRTLTTLHESIRKMFTNTWMNGWEEGVQAIHLPFFQQLLPSFLSAEKELRTQLSGKHIPEREGFVKDILQSIQVQTVLPIRVANPPKRNREEPIKGYHGVEFIKKEREDPVPGPRPVRPALPFGLNDISSSKKKLATTKVVLKPHPALQDLATAKSALGQKRPPRPKMLFNMADISGAKAKLQIGQPSKGAGMSALMKENFDKKAKQPGAGLKERLQATNEANAIEQAAVKAYSATTCRIHTLAKEQTLADAAATYNFAAYDLVFFDFDQTLTTPETGKEAELPTKGPKMKSTDGVKLRGAEDSLKALYKLSEEVGNLFIVTANQPSTVAANSVRNEVVHLKLTDVFKSSTLDKKQILQKLPTVSAVTAYSTKELTQLLIAFLTLLSSRNGEDMYRISYDTVHVAGKVVEFQLFQELDGKVNYSALSSKQVIEDERLSALVGEYLARRNQASVTSLVLRVTATQDTIGKEAMSKSEVTAFLCGFLDDIGLTFREKHELLFGASTEFKTSDMPVASSTSQSSVKLGVSGNIICSKYNKAEAIEFVLTYLEQAEVNQKALCRHDFNIQNKDALRQKTSLRIAFIDDSSENVFSVFNFFKDYNNASKSRLKATVEMHSIWFVPPSVGHHERINNRVIHGLVSKLSALSLLEGKDKQKPLSPAHVSTPHVLLLQEAPRDIAAAAKLVKQKLTAHYNAKKEKIGFVIFPEGFLYGEINANSPKATEKAFEPLKEIGKAFQVYIIAGTIAENDGGGKYYTTSVLISSKGTIAGLYRKQRVHNFQAQAQGDSLGIFDT